MKRKSYMNKNIQIINLINGDKKITKIEIDKTSIEIGAYFLKNIIKEFLKDNGDIEKIKKEYSGFGWTCENVCDMCVCDNSKRSKTSEK